MQFRTLKRSTSGAAFTLIEVLICMVIVGVVFVSLYTGMACGYSTVQLARENLRANQIITDRLEEMRIYGWNYLTNAGNVPANFVVPFFGGIPLAIDIGAEADQGTPSVVINPNGPYARVFREVSERIAQAVSVGARTFVPLAMSK